MSEIEAWISEIKPAEASVQICLRGDLLSEYDAANRQLIEHEDWHPSSLSSEDPRVPIRASMNALREDMKASTKKFTFRAIGDQAYSNLLAAHPSPKDDRGIDLYAFDPQKFPVALVSACCVEPTISLKQAEALFDKLNLSQRDVLFDGAMRANLRMVDIPFSAAGSGPADNTAPN